MKPSTLPDLYLEERLAARRDRRRRLLRLWLLLPTLLVLLRPR